MSMEKYGRAAKFVKRALNQGRSLWQYHGDSENARRLVEGHMERVSKLSRDAITDEERIEAFDAIHRVMQRIDSYEERFGVSGESVRASLTLAGFDPSYNAALGYEMDWDGAVANLELEEAECDIAPLMDRGRGRMVGKRLLAEASLGLLDAHTADVWTAIYAFDQNRSQADGAIPYQEVWAD